MNTYANPDIHTEPAGAYRHPRRYGTIVDPDDQRPARRRRRRPPIGSCGCCGLQAAPADLLMQAVSR